jgi:AcrR family transcriptional regulator
MHGRHVPNPARRSERSRQAILDAAFGLSRELGYGRVTIEAIAARAGVGKQTIYRWWHSRGSVMLDAGIQRAGPVIAFPDSGDVAADLRAQMSAVIGLMVDPVIGPVYTGLIADSQHDPVMADALYSRLIGPQIAAFGERLSEAQHHGQVARGIDPGVTAELLYGAIEHRLLLRSGTLTASYADVVTDVVLGGLRPRQHLTGGGPALRPDAEPAEVQPPATATPGPRSRAAILSAAYELCGRHGFHALTIEAVAVRAGVGKQTIYRWWPTKGAVVLDALLEVMRANTAYPDTGDIAADLGARLGTLVPLYAGGDFGPIYTGLIAESQFDARLAEDLHARLIGPEMAACRRRLLRAQEQGQIDRGLDRQCITEVLYGAVHHRLLLRGGRPLTGGYVATVIELAFAGVRPRRSRLARGRPAAAPGAAGRG